MDLPSGDTRTYRSGHPGGPGNTSGTDDALRQTMERLVSRVSVRLEDTAQVHPGHGDDATVRDRRRRSLLR